MRLIKRREPPFKTVEDALDFIKNNSLRSFLDEIKLYQDYLFSLYLRLIIIVFPFYLILSSVIFLFDDYGKINEDIYKFLNFIKIPMHSANGWNFSYVLSFIFNLYVFVVITKRNIRWVNKITRIDFSFLLNYMLAKTFLIFIVLFLFVTAHYVTLASRQTSHCIMADLCWLHTENMFLYSSCMVYLFHYVVFMLIFGLFFCANVDSRKITLLEVNNEK